MGVIYHNNDLSRSLPEKQAQADLIRLCREYRRRLGFHVTYNHVDGRLDDVLRWDQLTVNETYISTVFPHEPIVVNVAGKRVTGSPSAAIGRAWGYKVARNCSTRGK
jgi:hypothetical protein